MANPNLLPLDSRQLQIEGDEASPACVMAFNANDPSGAGGLTADITAITSAGAHPLAVVTGTYVRDTAEILDHFAFDDEAITDQARAALEDMPVSAFKVGFVGSPENISAIAEIASDYSDVPLIAYMPSLAWWDESEIDTYLDAFRELMLPQVTLLIGNHSTLWRWLLHKSLIHTHISWIIKLVILDKLKNLIDITKYKIRLNISILKQLTKLLLVELTILKSLCKLRNSHCTIVR